MCKLFMIPEYDFPIIIQDQRILINKSANIFIMGCEKAFLQCSYSKQGHPTKFSTNLTNKNHGG